MYLPYYGMCENSIHASREPGSDGAILGPGGNGPPDFQKKKISIYNILFLAFCFNKIALCPP